MTIAVKWKGKLVGEIEKGRLTSATKTFQGLWDEFRRFFRQLLLSSDGSPRWRRIGSLSKQTKGMPPDL